MKRILCILLMMICIFAFGSCNVSVNFMPLEQTDTDISTTGDITTPEPGDTATTSEETTPEVTTSEVTTSEVTTPEVTTPEVTTPEVTTPEVTTPEVTTPEVTTPEVTTPEVTTPEVTTPEVTTPEVTTPEVTTPEVTTPEVTTPEETTSAPDDDHSPDEPNNQNVIDAIIKKLAMLESVFQTDGRGWCMYNDIMGSAVTEVLSKQDLLIASGGNADDIHLAGQATENLRVLLKEYNDLRTTKGQLDYDKYVALYQYYTDNYDALTKNFCDLYKTLKGLYGNTVVSNYLSLKGKSEHYRQLVGHLFVVSTALDQENDRDEEAWRMDRKTLREVIEDVHYFPDGDWYPQSIDDIIPPEKPDEAHIITAIINKLVLLESVFQKDSRGWCMYNDIMGSAVTQTLQKKDALIAAGGNADDINLAAIATQNLRVLLKGYSDLRAAEYVSDYDKYKALYQYYVNNYDALKQNFCDLYKTLNGLYKNDAIHGYISLQEKTLHYRQLVGHLFVVSTALDQENDRDEDAWRIDRKTLREVIEDVHYFPDGDWYPSVLY